MTKIQLDFFIQCLHSVKLKNENITRTHQLHFDAAHSGCLRLAYHASVLKRLFSIYCLSLKFLPDQLQQKTVQTDSSARSGPHQHEYLRELQHHTHEQSAEVGQIQRQVTVHLCKLLVL